MKRLLASAAIATSAAIGLGLSPAAAVGTTVVVVTGNGAFPFTVVVTVRDAEPAEFATAPPCLQPVRTVAGVNIYYGVDGCVDPVPMILQVGQ
jgi:hypothetical protein